MDVEILPLLLSLSSETSKHLWHALLWSLPSQKGWASMAKHSSHLLLPLSSRHPQRLAGGLRNSEPFVNRRGKMIFPARLCCSSAHTGHTPMYGQPPMAAPSVLPGGESGTVSSRISLLLVTCFPRGLSGSSGCIKHLLSLHFCS